MDLILSLETFLAAGDLSLAFFFRLLQDTLHQSPIFSNGMKLWESHFIAFVPFQGFVAIMT